MSYVMKQRLFELVFHPTSLLAAWLGIVINAPLTFLFIGSNFVQHEIEVFLNESYELRFNSTLNTAQVKTAFGLLMSINFISALLTVPLIRLLLDQIGRKPVLFGGMGFFSLLSSLLIVAARRLVVIELLYLSRTCVGVVWAVYFVGLPTYLSEVCPPKTRGFCQAVVGVMTAVTIVVTQILSLPSVLGNSEYWDIFFCTSCIQSLLCLVSIPFLPETPKYIYIQKKDEKAARKVLKRYYGKNENINDAIKAFEAELHHVKKKTTFRCIWRAEFLRKAAIIAVLLQLSRLAGGGLLLSVFSTAIATDQIGMDPADSKHAMIAISCLRIIAAMLAAYLIERIGRRKLYFFCAFSMASLQFIFIALSAIDRYAIEIGIAGKYCAVTAIYLVTIFQSMGFEVVTMHFVTEMTPQNARSTVMSFASIVGLFIRIFYFGTFPIASKELGFFAVLLLLFIPVVTVNIYLLKAMPETKGKHIAEVLDMWKQKTVEAKERKISRKQSKISMKNLAVEMKDVKSVNGGINGRV